MFSPVRKVSKLTCRTCEHSFSSKGNLSRHFSVFPDHRPEPERIISSREAVGIFLDNLSPYHRQARVRELFYQLTDEELVELALPRLARLIPTSRFVFEKCKKRSGEIVAKAVKDELQYLCDSLYWTFPSIPRESIVSGRTSALLHNSKKKATRWQGICTPDRRFAQFVDDRSELKSLLEQLITANENLACETMLNCCDGRIVKNTLIPLFVKKYHEAFLQFGLGIVSSFNIGQNQLNSVLRGYWGKKLAEKTGLNPILPR